MDQNSQNKTDDESADKLEAAQSPPEQAPGASEAQDGDETPDIAFNPLPAPGHALSEEDIKRFYPSRWPVNLVASFTLISGLVAAIQPLAARLAEHPRLFSVLVTTDYYHFSKSLHVAFGLFLIYLSINLFKRKRNAWYASVAMSAGSALLHIARIGAERIKFIPDPDVSESIPLLTLLVPILTVVLLLIYKKQFTVLSESHRIRTGIRKFLLSVLLAIAYGTIGFFLLEKHDFGLNFQLSEALSRSLRELFFIGNPDLVARSASARWFINSLHIIGGLAAAFAVYSVFRPIQYQLSTHPRERERAQSLLKQYGKDALDHYKILSDKSYYFLQDGNSFIAYKTVLNVAIGLGDPVGPPEELEKVTKQFHTFCKNNDWSMAFLQVKPDNVELYEKLGLEVLKVGEEAIVDLNKFATDTSKGKNFKSKVKKFDKEGYVLERLAPPHSRELVDTVQRVSDAWLSLPGRRERGFSLGWFDREEVEKDILFVLKNPQRDIIAFVNQVPSYGPGEASIDMMRHNEDVPNGTMDYLFTKLLTALKEDGFETFSLGLAALSGVGDQPGASMEERAIHQIYEHMNRFFSYKGLRQYKNKFSPIWKASYLVYENGPPGLIKTALAITRAGELSLDDED